MKFEIKPIAFVKNSRREMTDDFWGDVISEIELTEEIPAEAFDGIESFSHLEIIFCFHLVKEEEVFLGSRHPRGNKNFPSMGIFAQRPKIHPNKLGLTTAKLLKHEGRKIFVQGLDAIDGTPVIDIKPVMKEFIAREEITQPPWVSELLKDYWK